MSERDSERRGRRMVGHVVRRGIPIFVLVGVVLLFILYWQHMDAAPGHEAAPGPSGPMPVRVMAVKRETVRVQVRFLGQTEGSQVVEIRARVAGYLQERNFEEGTRVEKGRKLFQIDPRPFQVELEQAQALRASAQATLERARQQLERTRRLTTQRVATQEELDEWVTQEKVAAAEMQRADAQIAAAQLQLGYTTIEAPITGMIGQALKDVGSYVDAGQNGLLAVIEQVDPIYVGYSVTEQEMLRFERERAIGLVRVPPIDQVELEIVLSDGSTFGHRGRINFVDIRVDETTGTSVVRGQVPNPDGLLKPGQFIHANVLGVERINVIRVPQGAVTQSPTGASVLVVNREGVAEARPIVLGEWTDDGHWIVDRGLEEGDRVIVDRLMMVRAGMPVTIAAEIDTTTQPATSPATREALNASSSTVGSP